MSNLLEGLVMSIVIKSAESLFSRFESKVEEIANKLF